MEKQSEMNLQEKIEFAKLRIKNEGNHDFCQNKDCNDCFLYGYSCFSDNCYDTTILFLKDNQSEVKKETSEFMAKFDALIEEIRTLIKERI
jgi:hypothetical protein